jgi:tetratricopeptide (TPR) repeat protein
MVWPYIPEAAHGYFDPAWYQNRHLYKATKVWNLVDTRNKADVQHFSALITAECNQAIKEDPSCYGAYMIRSNVYEYSGDLKNAVTDALKYASLQPTDMSIYPVLGRIYDKLQLPEEAFRAWDKALGGQQAPPSDKLHVVSMAPDFFFHGASTTRLYENRGWDEVKLGNFKSAMKDLAWVDYLRGGDDWQTVELAMAYAMDGDPDRSLTLLKNYSSSFSSTYYDAHKTMRVLKQYVWSLERAQKRDRATFVSLGKALGFRWIDQSQRVMPELNKVIATDPQFADLYVWRGTESWRDNPALALSQYNKALQLDPGNALALYYRAALFNDQKNYNSAISDCNQLLHGDFRNNALAMRAETYLGLHRYADAAADCANALASEQAWTDAHVLMADALERQGITEGALQQLHQARDYYGEGRCNTDLATINAGIDRLEKMKKDRK